MTYGVGIISDAVGSKFNEGALSLTGTGNDFYGLSFAKMGSFIHRRNDLGF